MSQNIHCSNSRPLPMVYIYLIQLLLVNLLTDLTRIDAQSAINAELSNLIQQHHSHYPNVHYPNVQPNVEHHQSDDNANDEHNDLDLYDEPLFFEESEFNEHSADGEHRPLAPFQNAAAVQNVVHAARLDSAGLTLIPSAVRPEQHAYQTIYLPVILPIHKRKLADNQTESCSNEEINSPAIYDLEAILWTLDQVNQLEVAHKSGLIFHLAVIDSCSSPAVLEKRLKNLLNLNGNATSSAHVNATSNAIDQSGLPAFNMETAIGIVCSIPSAEFTVAHNLLSPLNITLLSAQDISFLPSKLGVRHHALQTALPIDHFASAALQHLKQANKRAFSIIYSNDSLSSTTMLDALVKWITVENAKDNQIQLSKDGKESKKKGKPMPAFCINTLNVPSNLNTGEASQLLIQLQNELKNGDLNSINASIDSTVLILTESHTTRELLIAYQHLINAGILNRFSFVLIKESNLNIVTGIESSMLNTLVIRESQKSLRDFVEYFEQLRLKSDNNLRNPFFKQYWQQSVNCGLNRDCLFDQIEPINTINSIQSAYALINSIITTRNEFCVNRMNKKSTAPQPVFCRLLFNSSNNESDATGKAATTAEQMVRKAEKSKSITDLKAILLDQLTANELDLHQLSKHFNHAIRFGEQAAYPDKSVDVLKFRVLNQAYRFDRIASYLNSGLIGDDQSSASSLVLNPQLLTCRRSTSPFHSSLTRSNLSVKSKLNNNWYHSWWFSVATILSLLGTLISIVCAVYFLFTFDYRVGSTILGYMILLGIFLLYMVNFFFLYPYSFMTCWLREYLMSIAYTIILASMLVKVMNHWRLNTYHNYNNLYIQHLNLVNGSSNLNNAGFNNFNNFNNQHTTNIFLSKKLNSISTLMSMCLGLVSLESLTNLVWLAIYPPRPQQIVIDGLQQWKCFNIQFAVLIETDSIFSVLFVVLLILITMFFSALTWKHSAINSYESRWIMFSCYVMLITWTVWAFLFKMFHLVELRDLFIVIANLLVATSILICMFIRKLIIFYRLNKAKKYTNKTHHLVSSPSIASYNGSAYNSFNGSVSSYYGSVGGASIGRSNSTSSATTNKKISAQLKRTAKQTARQMSKTAQQTKKHQSSNQNQTNADNLDNMSTISAITTTSSIISSVKSYFTNGKHKPDTEPSSNLEPDFHLASITVDQGQLANAIQQQNNNLQQELYPMDVYETGRPNQAQSNIGGSQQPDSLFYTTKKSIFNSNHSLYLMEEKDYM